MSDNWQKAYTGLTDFISKHSEIEIRADMVSIPENVRPEFYRLFNAVRTVFIEEKLPNLLNEATALSQNYLKAEQEVVRLLGLDDVSMEASLGRFLHDPIDELRRGSFDPLFDLLKVKVGIETFEERASQNIEASFGPLYRLGYEKWVALSLVRLLKADKSFKVIIQELSTYDVHKAGGFLEEPVPAPEESKDLSFKYELEAAFIVPDLIVRSAKVNRYVSVRSQYGEALARATNASEKREWYPLDSIRALEPGLTLLIYVADNPDEISLVADVEKIYRPDLIIECRGQKDWYQEEGLEKAKLHHDSLKPILGTYIVSREPVPVEEPEKQEEDIHILTVGFDQSELEPIISIMMNQEDEENSK